MRRFFPALVASLTMFTVVASSNAQQPEAGDKNAVEPQAPRIKNYRPNSVPSAEEAAIKPTPLEPFPDTPPPHEGAMIKVAHRIQAPDLLIIEVLEALPGRPITGEHLVRGDGKISLGFYGEVDVAGLTLAQAKVKITLHLRTYLTDRALGLVYFTDSEPAPLARPGTIIPFDDPDDLPPVENSLPSPFTVNDRNSPLLKTLINPIPILGPAPATIQNQPATPQSGDKTANLHEGNELIRKEMPEDFNDASGKYIAVAPEDTPFVFVDVASYNSCVYYVTGGFRSPGRLPWTGNETVFDAIQYAGGLASPNYHLWLHRPARGGKPRRSFRIDLDAINCGEETENLQMLPGDRLVAHTADEEKRLAADFGAR